MASCCAPGRGTAKPRGRQLVVGGATGACNCSNGDNCECATCTCLGCPCKPERVLTAALKRTGSPAQLNDLVRRHWGRLNSVHVSAALSSLAAFVSAGEKDRGDYKAASVSQEPESESAQAPTPTSSSSAPVVSSSLVVSTLLDALGRHVHEMAPRALSASVWTLAILRPTSAELAPMAPVVAAAVTAHLERGSFEPRDVAIVMWSYATLGASTLSYLPLGPHLPCAFETYTVTAAGTGGAGAGVGMSPRDLSMVMWSAATLRLRGVARSVVFIRGATQTLASGAMKLEPRQLAQCLWGFATLTAGGAGGSGEDGGGSGERSSPGAVSTDEKIEEAVGVVEEEGSWQRARAAFLRTCAALVALPRFVSSPSPPGGENVSHVDQGREGYHRGGNPQDLSNALHSFAACRWHPGDDALRAVAAAVTSTSNAFTAEEAADVLWAIATLHPHLGNNNEDTRGDGDGDRVGQGAGAGSGGQPAEERVAACPHCSGGESYGAGDNNSKEAAAAAASAVDATVSNAVTALSSRVAALCAAASSSSSSPSPCFTDFDAQVTSNALWAAAVLGRCTGPEAAPLWRVARAKIQLSQLEQMQVQVQHGEGGSRGGGGKGEFSGAGLMQLFYASWCFLEEGRGDGAPAEDEQVAEGFAREPLGEGVRRIHEYAAEFANQRRGRVIARTSKLQLSVAAAASELPGLHNEPGVLAVEVEAEVVVGQFVNVATTVDLLLTLTPSPPVGDGSAGAGGGEASPSFFIVEVDGPTHFTQGSGGEGGTRGQGGHVGREVGGTALRNRLLRGGCARGRRGRFGGFVALPYYVLDDASSVAGRAGIVDVLREALTRVGAPL